jgi:diketogulonate reductase-like aldo/keto reductase
MIERTIPSSRESIPVIGLGTWKRFDVGPSDTERAPLRRVLSTLSAVPGAMIDSSPMYGRSETVVGDLTSGMGPEPKFFYATKVWMTGEKEGIRQMEESFVKMRRTTMDLMQIHNLVDWKTHLNTLRRWKDEGKIRYIGITHYQSSAHAELERIITAEKLDFVQCNYSLRERNAEQRLFPAAVERGVAVIVNEPFEKGALFSAVRGTPLPPWAMEHGIVTWSAFFLNFILSHPAVTCVIPATADEQHMLENIDAGALPLPEEPLRKRMIHFIESM